MVAINNKKLLKNNKGISLIDIMIAIAVLAILITPIILQVTTTINTSAKAKEKQYVVDSAASVMEYFKQTSMDDIKKNAPTATDKNIDFKNEEMIDNMDTVAFKGAECHIFVDGNDTGAVVKYNGYDVALNDVKLGRAKREYDRTVVISDLANKLLSGKASNGKRYRINYEVDLNKSSSTYTKIKADSAFEIQSDHSAVKFETVNHGGVDYSHISAVDCVEVTDSSYVDPNSVSLGNIQDLDSDKIAIIEGEATKLDHRFEKDLIAMFLDYDSRHKGSSMIDDGWFDNPTLLNANIKGLIKANTNTFNRMIMIAVTARKNAAGKIYYHVDVKVRYYLKFNNTSYKVFNGSNEGQKTYEVMNRDFFTSEPPDVYMIYEPFITDYNSAFAEYAYTDYVTIQSDPYTSGYYKLNPPDTAEDYSKYDASKIYLIKPTNSWQTASGAANGIDPSDADYEQKKNMYYTLKAGSYVPVKISVNQVYSTVDMGDGNVVNYTPSECYPLQIITNISSYHDDSLNVDWVHNGISNPKDKSSIIADDSDEVQFVRSYDSNACPKIDSTSGEGTRAAYSLGIKADESQIGDLYFEDGDGDECVYSIVPWQGESNYSGKVYNITVTYKSPTGDVTYLTGAKGAD